MLINNNYRTAYYNNQPAVKKQAPVTAPQIQSAPSFGGKIFSNMFFSKEAGDRKIKLKELAGGRYDKKLADEFVKLKPEQWQNAKKILNIPERKEQLKLTSVIAFSKMPKEQFENVCKFTYVESRKDEQFSDFDIDSLCKLKPENLKRAQDIINDIPNSINYTGMGISMIANLNDEKWQRAQKLMQYDFSSDDIYEIAKSETPLTNKVMDNLDYFKDSAADKASILELTNCDASRQDIKMFDDFVKFMKDNRSRVSAHLDTTGYMMDNCLKESCGEVLSTLQIVGAANLKDIAMKRLPYLKNVVTNSNKIEQAGLHKDVAKVIQDEKLNSTQSIKLINIINAYQEFFGFDNTKKAINELGGDTDKISAVVAKKIFKEKLGIEANNQEKLAKLDLRYVHTLPGVKQLDETTRTALKDVLKIELSNKDFNYEYHNFLFDRNTDIGKANFATKREFEDNRLDFDKWLSHNAKMRVSMSNVALEDLKNSSFNCLKDLKANGVQVDDKMPEGEISLEELKSIRQKAEEQVQKWNVKNKNTLKEDFAKITEINEKFASLYTKKSLKDIEKANNSYLTLEMCNRNPIDNLFLGNYTQCCIAFDRTNAHSLVESLVNTVDQNILIKDKDEVVGKVKLFWAKDEKTKKPILIANGFEIQEGYTSPQIGTAIRDTATKYMEEYAKEVSGKDDTKLYMGLQNEDVPETDAKNEKKDIKVIGSSYNDYFYLCSLGGDVRIKESQSGEFKRLI